MLAIRQSSMRAGNRHHLFGRHQLLPLDKSNATFARACSTDPGTNFTSLGDVQTFSEFRPGIHP